MLHFPLLLLSLCAVTVVKSLSKEFDISSCPVEYYGMIANSIRVTGFYRTNGYHKLCLKPHSDRATKDCIRVRPTVKNTHLIMMAPLEELPDVMVDKLGSLLFRNQTVHCAFRIAMQDVDGTQDDFYFANIGRYYLLYVHSDIDPPPRAAAFTFGPNGFIDVYRHKSGTPFRFVLDLTGCRTENGEINKTPAWDLFANCKTFTGCQPNNSLVTENLCGPDSQCDGKGVCLSSVKCSVIASMVLDVREDLQSVVDSCAYTLLSTNEFDIVGVFNYRRHTRAPFLDKVQLTLDFTTYEIGQGGQVTVNGSVLELTTQNINDMELFVDDSGSKLSNSEVMMFFDGTGLYIWAKKVNVLAMDGLCVESGRSAQKKNRLMDLSELSCRREYNDEPDNSIDCAELENICESTFSGSFTNLCSKLLCKHGNINRLMCHIKTGYNRRTGFITDNQGCEQPPSCFRHHCARHEHCEETEAGQVKCSCRKPFTDLYIERGKFGEKTRCEVEVMFVEVPTCLLELKGFDVSELHLLDRHCRGHVNTETHMVGFNFTQSELCGANMTTNATHIVFNNVVSVLDVDDSVITRDDDIFLHFSCIYELPKGRGMIIDIMDRSVIQMFKTGRYKYTVDLNACHGKKCETKVRPRDSLKLKTRLRITLKVDELDTSMALVINSCWATVNPNGKGKPRHKLITDGCKDPGDPTVKVIENGDDSDASFAFNVFRFRGRTGPVHLFCNVSLCRKEETNCIPDCEDTSTPPPPVPFIPPSPGRRRRSVDTGYTETWPTMSWIYQGEFAEGD